MPNLVQIIAACVPFPAPGGPTKSSLMEISPLFLQPNCRINDL
jgi:hypothetical protein